VSERVRIGSLNELVTIQRDSGSTRDAAGEPSESFADYMANVYANVEPMTADEIVRRGLTVQMRPITARIRWASGKTPVQTDRLIWQSATYDITSVVQEGGRDRFWTLTAVKAA
jgi:head-tail adaptor